MKQTKTKPVMVLYPPRIEISSLTNKYDFILRLSWGDFNKDVKVNREEGSFFHKLIVELNKALLEGSETKPYHNGL